jgi:hypothetical protein
MQQELNSSDRLFERLLPEIFEPFFCSWKSTISNVADYAGIYIDHDYCGPGDKDYEIYEWTTADAVIYQNPIVKNSFAVCRNNEIWFIHKTGEIDMPSTHRFMGPAMYTIDGNGIKNLRWFFNNKEYSEYDYWMLICRMFCDKLQMCLSGDECCYHIENNRYDLPFPLQINLPIDRIEAADDVRRTDLNGHMVWNIKHQPYVQPEIFWTHWEKRGFDLKTLF